MKRILFNLLPAIFLWLGTCSIANAQATGDQITQGNQIIQNDGSTTGRFEPVTVDASTTSSVNLQFPLSMAGKTLAVNALDGGVVQIGNSTIDQSGMLSFSFQTTGQAGVYRVIAIYPSADQDSLHIVAMVQFQVPNPAQ